METKWGKKERIGKKKKKKKLEIGLTSCEEPHCCITPQRCEIDSLLHVKS